MGNTDENTKGMTYSVVATFPNGNVETLPETTLEHADAFFEEAYARGADVQQYIHYRVKAPNGWRGHNKRVPLPNCLRDGHKINKAGTHCTECGQAV